VPANADFRFGPFRLDGRRQLLLRDEVAVFIQPRLLQLLQVFVERPDTLLTTDELIEAVWKGTAVTDASLTQALFRLRNLLDPDDPARYIETASRIGYRFVAPVSRAVARQDDADLDAMLAPHRIFMDGRAALETLGRAQIAAARTTFENLVRHHPHDASFRVGLASACAFWAEATQTDAARDRDAIREAVVHAREACRLSPGHAEAWATLGFALARTGATADALAAHARAVALEPENWRHHLRFAYDAWGEDRLTASKRALERMPGLALARWLAATVYAARGVPGEAKREIDAGLAVTAAAGGPPSRFAAVGLHWLKGLLALARGDDEEALAAWAEELALEDSGHMYAREMAANTWSAIGACELGRGNHARARQAFDESIARVPAHAMSSAGLLILDGGAPPFASAAPLSFDQVVANAAVLVSQGDVDGAVAMVANALAAAPPGATGWRLPIEPLLCVPQNADAWAPVMIKVRERAM
jgi:DNA-binding winged helix-turn-helix (wHTH) protein